MSDRTSCRIFADILEILVSGVPGDFQGVARDIWQLSQQYDFSPCDMGQDASEAAVVLGIARRVREDDYDTYEWLFNDYEDER